MKRSNAIVFDLDDTLINTHSRHYFVTKYIIERLNYSFESSFDVYKDFRREHQASALNFFINTYQPDSQEIEQFRKLWIKNIESLKFLAKDEAIYQENFFDSLAKEHNAKLIILSLRSHHENAQKQMDHFGINKYFEKIIFVQHAKDKNPKVEVLQEIKQEYNILMFVGDSATDMQAAQEANVKFIGVNTGLYKLEYEEMKESIHELR